MVGVDGRSYGTVEAVEANPASDLLVLPGGRLVPLVFVVSGPTAGRVVIDPPAGLLDSEPGPVRRIPGGVDDEAVVVGAVRGTCRRR